MPANAALEETDHRPGLVIVSNEQTPYRLHFHRRIVNEIPELRLWSVFTHEQASSPWKYEEAPEISPVLFGKCESTKTQASVRHALREWRKGGRIIKWMRRRNVAAVIVNGYNDAGRVRLILWCKRRGLPVLLFGDSNILCDPTAGFKARAKKLVLPWLLSHCDAILCCGSLGRAYFQKYGVPDPRIFTVPYHPDYEELENVSENAKARISAKHGLRPGRRRILYAGRLEHVKRVDLLLKAFESIAMDRPLYDLVLAGDGTLGPELRASVAPELHNRIIWTGFVPEREELAALYAVSDLLVLPSDYEPWGVVISEAAVHLAIVASSVVGAAAELVCDGVNGSRFPAGDESALTAALLEVTRADSIDKMKAASRTVLADWRLRAAPVAGLRSALASVSTATDCSMIQPAKEPPCAVPSRQSLTRSDR